MSDPSGGERTAKERALTAKINAILDDRWPLTGDIIDAFADSGLMTAPTLPDGLDVERLTRALRVIDTRRTIEHNAPLVAACYAALTAIREASDDEAHYPGCPEDETCGCAGRTVKAAVQHTEEEPTNA